MKDKSNDNTMNILEKNFKNFLPTDDSEENAEFNAICDQASAKVLSGELKLKEALAIDPNKLEVMYAIAYELYKNEKYEKCLTIMTVLCFFDPVNVKYLTCLAACRKQLGNFNEALIAYYTILQFEKHNISYYLDIAECLLQLKFKKEAIQVLESTLELWNNKELIKSKPEDGKHISKIKNLLVILKK